MTKQPSWQNITQNPATFLAFGFGSGLSPIMPGTMGTLASIPLYLCLVQLPLLAYIGVVVIAAIVGVYFCNKASEQMGVHDHGGIVWDEFVGFWITMIAVPFSWWNVLAGFVIFRIFDMAKPWPISVADKKIHGGFGIMFDDVLAGVISAIVLHVGLYFLGL